MHKPRVFVTRNIPDVAVNILEEQCQVDMWPETDIPVPRHVLEQQIAQADALFCLLTDTIDAPLLTKAKRLKVISNMAVGYNNIDVQAAADRNVIVTNTPGVLTETTADLTFALLLGTARRVVEASDTLRSGKWKTWSPMFLTGQDVYDATLGIIGFGRIGQAVARRATGFNMNIVYSRSSRKHEAEESLGATYVEMDELLHCSDFVSILVPYTVDTHHLIGKDELRKMKSTSILINTARGGIVDEAALYNALHQGDIWAAGLDVFETEPVPTDHPLLSLPNVVTLPHIGSASIATRTKMALLAAEQVIQVLRGETPTHLVRPVPK